MNLWLITKEHSFLLRTRLWPELYQHLVQLFIQGLIFIWISIRIKTLINHQNTTADPRGACTEFVIHKWKCEMKPLTCSIQPEILSQNFLISNYISSSFELPWIYCQGQPEKQPECCYLQFIASCCLFSYRSKNCLYRMFMPYLAEHGISL